jgi:hypothetical protein
VLLPSKNQLNQIFYQALPDITRKPPGNHYQPLPGITSLVMEKLVMREFKVKSKSYALPGGLVMTVCKLPKLF